MSKPRYVHDSLYQSQMFDTAYEYWSNGKQAPLDLMAAMANEGMDVAQLEAAYMEIE